MAINTNKAHIASETIQFIASGRENRPALQAADHTQPVTRSSIVDILVGALHDARVRRRPRAAQRADGGSFQQMRTMLAHTQTAALSADTATIAAITAALRGRVLPSFM